MIKNSWKASNLASVTDNRIERPTEADVESRLGSKKCLGQKLNKPFRILNLYLLGVACSILLNSCSEVSGKQHKRLNDSLKQVLAERGLEPLRNPATFYQPGTLLKSSSATDLDIACENRDAFDDIADRVRSSPTSIFSVNLNNQRSLDGSAALASLASISAEHKKDVTVSVEILNPVISVIRSCFTIL